jgi:hypothetical protein
LNRTGALKLFMFSFRSICIYSLASLFLEMLNWDKEYYSIVAGCVSLCGMSVLLCLMHFLDFFNIVLIVGSFFVVRILKSVSSCGTNGQRISC